ncbi:CCA tRNA nucleotidyltransferase [Gluconacetobacter entanii]|uniref:Poly(A) polymerase n=1 Tax=Gluconacetobacter entanii TaxID=108528 RepID=A0A318Q1Q5_9PROT|nr:CCA tRNA nucleotidyltransferase [Gluconacetobacter entanii]MCE2577111.1 CCA tRNA nucleotidyltransferase [Komagataeibacter sp. FNDCR1]PYD64702.1 poly(A) polymerase [Gluconacetobacter entanii]
MNDLPPAATLDPLARLYRTRPDTAATLARIWDVLPDARLVGGAVRDLLCGRAVTDMDLATAVPPSDVMARLRAAGIRVVPTGLVHGTVTAVIDGRPHEITTLRRDVQTDGRHAQVAWTDDWREDAARRDFTINAMSCDRAGVVHDPFGGQADLAAARVRFVGDARARITEDALRILRFFRFNARYGGDVPDAEAMAAATALAPMVERLSVERIWSELRRILAGPRVAETLALMEHAGVLARILPEGYDLSRLGRLLACDGPVDPLLRCAALFAGDVAEIAQRLRLSRADGRFMLAVRDGTAPHPGMTAHDIARMLAADPAEILIARAWLRQAHELGRPDARWDGLRDAIARTPRPVFPLAGRDVVAAGCTPGPRVGEVLEQVRQWWLAGGCEAARAACLAHLRQVLAG